MSEIQFRSDVTVELVRAAAQDADVLFAARVSTQGEQTLEGAKAADEDVAKRDKGLINYLMRDRHGSPFEHNSLTFYVQAPIFVFREFMRHRIASYNEESGRYKELSPVFYVPGPERNLVQIGKTGHYEFIPGTAEQTALVGLIDDGEIDGDVLDAADVTDLPIPHRRIGVRVVAGDASAFHLHRDRQAHA